MSPCVSRRRTNTRIQFYIVSRSYEFVITSITGRHYLHFDPNIITLIYSKAASLVTDLLDFRVTVAGYPFTVLLLEYQLYTSLLTPTLSLPTIEKSDRADDDW